MKLGFAQTVGMHIRIAIIILKTNIFLFKILNFLFIFLYFTVVLTVKENIILDLYYYSSDAYNKGAILCKSIIKS